MKRKFTFLIAAAFMLLTMMASTGRMWGQSDYSSDYTGNITLSTDGGSNASACEIKIGGTNYAGIKAGTSSKAGAVMITVPSGTKYLHIHAAAWNNTTASLKVTPEGYSDNISLTANSGIANNSPFTFNGDASTSDYYKVITFSDALTANTDLTFTAVGGKRFVIWGVTSEEESSGDTPSITADDVDIAYDVTSESIVYEIENYVAGTMAANTTADWISDFTYQQTDEIGEVGFTTTVNESISPRSATVTLTYTYGAKSTVNKDVTVTQDGNPNASGGANNPYTVAQAIAAIDAGTGVTNVFATGIVSSVGYFSESNHYITYNISDNGLTTGNQLQAFHGKGLDGVDFTSQDDVQVGDVVIIYGDLTKYGNTYEFTAGNYLVSQIRPEKVATPTFSPEAGTYYEAKDVTIACTTEGASIFYKLAENDDWSAYTTAINVATTTTIWAKATKNGMNDSNIASATYTINTEPVITINPASYNATAAGETTSFNIDYINCGNNPEVHWFDANDIEQPLGIDWINTEFIGGYYVYQCTIAANTDEERVAKFEIRARDDNSNVYTSNRVTINQAAYVPSYTVTFDCDGGTFVANTDFTTVSESKEAGTYNLPSATKTGWDFAGWNDGTTTYEANAEYTVSAAVAFTAQWTEITTGSIVFGNNGTKINEASVTGDDSFGNTWTITTVGTTSFTQQANYSQVGSSNNPATSITFTTTLPSEVLITAFSAKFGGFSGTAGNVTLKVGETQIGSDDLNGSTDVIVANTIQSTGTVLTVTVTDIAKGVKCYYISYTIDSSTDPIINTVSEVNLGSLDTYGEFEYSIIHPATGVNLTAASTDEWISNITVTDDKVTFNTTVNTSATDDREGTITLSYTDAENKIVTVIQSKVDYATIPFTFTGGKNAIETTAGLTENGLGNDYSSTANLRFDDTGDWVVLHLNEAPVSLSYDIKGNSFTSGSFAVQYSSNGTDYNTKVTYTEADITNSVKTFTIIDFPNETKYIRWIFTKSTGNVGFGNIRASKEYDTYGDVTIDSDALATHSVTVHSGSVVTFVGTNTNADKLVIEDGGQLIHTGDVAATLLKDYKATTWPNTKSVSGWYTIASPVDGAYVSVVTTTANYDFYAYDEANYTWRNEKVPANGITTFEQGVGYLYATSADKQGSFAGTMKATNAEVEKDLSYECTLANMKGFNLMGNPFTRNLTSGDVKLGDSYLTNYFVVEGGSELVAREIATYPIKPGQGFMVQATAENQKLVFNPSTAKGRSTNNGHISIAVGNESFNDMAYINIANGNTLRKMTLNTDSPKVYVMNNNKDYAAARVENLSASMPVCFQTKNIGTYTITVKANELDVEYLHLIDNVLHEDIDLLLEPSYSFIASGHDNAARFTLVFKANANIDEIEANDIFAYQNGSDIIVNGNGELQVFDATGRMVMNTQVNGIQTVNIPATGMYIFRMVGDEVKTQKIVVR